MAMKCTPRVCSCWKAAGLPHSGGKCPVRLVYVRVKLCSFGNDGPTPQDDGSVPEMGVLAMESVDSKGNAPCCDHVAGMVPAHAQRQLPLHLRI